MATAKASVEEERNVLILGISGSGKTTIANKIAQRGSMFDVETKLPIVQRKITIVDDVGDRMPMKLNYKIRIMDTIGLLDSPLDHKVVCRAIKKHINSKRLNLHLILFVHRYSHGHTSRQDIIAFQKILKLFSLRVQSISALIVTHCDHEFSKSRKDIEDEFGQTEITDSITLSSFMQRGIFSVGFPNEEGSGYCLRNEVPSHVKEDRKKLVDLIKRSNDPLDFENLWSSQCNIL